MAQVPYNPVPQVQPTEAAIPGVRVNAPTEAFGGATARALEGLGGVTEKAGNELFQRAVALQQLNNETEAKAADADYMIKAGDIHANYQALQGMDRVKAFPKYSKDLEELRVKIRDGLSNDMSRRMYDSSSLSTMSRSIFNGAGAAAAANKEYTIGTAKAQLDIDTKTIEDDPSAFDAKLGKIQNSARSLAAQQGFPANSPQEQDLVMKATSSAALAKAKGMARTAPFEAQTWLEKNKGLFTQQDYDRADASVTAQGRAVGSVNIANSVYDPDKPLKDMEAEATAKAEKQNPNDPLLATHAVAALRTRYNQDKYATQREQYSNEQIILGALQKGVENDQQLFADPKVKAAYDALPASSMLKKKPINYQIQKYNSARDAEVMDDNWVRLRGLASNDVEGFLNTNIMAEKLSPDKRDRLLTLRDQLIKNQSADPRVSKAVGILRGSMGSQLEALGIYKRTDSNKEDFDHFTGTLQSAIDAWQETHGKPPTAKDLTETIGPQVIKERAEPGLFFGTNQVPFFKQTVPNEFIAKARKEAGNPNLPEEQIYKLWTALQYRKLYGGK